MSHFLKDKVNTGKYSEIYNKGKSICINRKLIYLKCFRLIYYFIQLPSYSVSTFLIKYMTYQLIFYHRYQHLRYDT